MLKAMTGLCCMWFAVGCAIDPPGSESTTGTDQSALTADAESTATAAPRVFPACDGVVQWTQVFFDGTTDNVIGWKTCACDGSIQVTGQTSTISLVSQAPC